MEGLSATTVATRLVSALNAHGIAVQHMRGLTSDRGPTIAVETTQAADAAAVLHLSPDDPDNPAPVYTGRFEHADVVVYQPVRYAVVDTASGHTVAHLATWPAANALASVGDRPRHVEAVPR